MNCDLLIIGQGPAGTALAKFATDRKMSVIAIDRADEQESLVQFEDMFIQSNATGNNALREFGIGSYIGGQSNIWAGRISSYFGNEVIIGNRLDQIYDFFQLKQHALVSEKIKFHQNKRIIPFTALTNKFLWKNWQPSLQDSIHYKLLKKFIPLELKRNKNVFKFDNLIVTNNEKKLNIKFRFLVFCCGVLENTFLVNNFAHSLLPNLQLDNFQFPLKDHFNFKNIHAIFENDRYKDYIGHRIKEVFYKIFSDNYCFYLADSIAANKTFPSASYRAALDSQYLSKKLSLLYQKNYSNIKNLELKAFLNDHIYYKMNITDQVNKFNFKKMKIIEIKSALIDSYTEELLYKLRLEDKLILHISDKTQPSSSSHFMGTTLAINKSNKPHVNKNFRVEPFDNLFTLGNNCFLHETPINPTAFLIYKACELADYLNDVKTT